MKPKRFLGGRVTLRAGDCMAVVAQLPENSVDSIITDTPYHLASIVERFGAEGAAPAKVAKTGAFARAGAGFIGKKWDDGDIAFRVATWKALLRVLKPGGYLVAFASSRGFGRLAVAAEQAGFVTHPLFGWIYGNGFPKATVIRADGYEGVRYGAGAIKPALEPIYVGQKPFSETNGTANIQLWGTGGINIESGRVPGELVRGRWPANLLHDGSDGVIAALPDGAPNFFYCAKASAEDRLGFEHPTIKPLSLMQYLCRLFTPTGGMVLDPFAGTGTTAEAAYREGRRALLIEREPQYLRDIAIRMELADNPTKRAAVVAASVDGMIGAEGTPLFSRETAE